ncbi:hypothetical protein [Micromonospora musae]|uniref:hypothetical protein n=1 Tax=Micromonospora musae TaxID=1894970 RepID=UPI003428E065
MRKAVATVSIVALVGLLTAGGAALIWIPVQAIINFEPQSLAWGSPSGPPVTVAEQRSDLILDSVLPIGLGIILLVLAVVVVKAFIGHLRK